MKQIGLISCIICLFITSAAAQADRTMTFAVFSDPHFYDPSLGTSGKAFEDYLDRDRKLLRESEELLQEAISYIKNSDASFVLIPGDLTKDGSLVSHTRFAAYLKTLEESGKQVYVVPGNHDVLNNEAMSFRGDSAIPVANINPEDFARIYRQFGYDEALERDPASLSYVAEPQKGTWLLALDACRYMENEGQHHPVTDGRISVETLNWVRQVLLKAKEENKRVFAMMHHGLVEHYKGQEKYYGEYLVDDYNEIGKLLAMNGVKLVFTGHYHAQDLAMKRYSDEAFLVDIETGSLVTYPCPVRTIIWKNDSLSISSWKVESIPSHPDNFQAFAKDYVIKGIAGIAENTLIGMGLRPVDASKLSTQVGLAFCAHYEGDETAPDKALDLKGVNLLGRFIISFRKSLVKGLYNDLEPADNNLEINLRDGSWTKK